MSSIVNVVVVLLLLELFLHVLYELLVFVEIINVSINHFNEILLLIKLLIYDVLLFLGEFTLVKSMILQSNIQIINIFTLVMFVKYKLHKFFNLNFYFYLLIVQLLIKLSFSVEFQRKTYLCNLFKKWLRTVVHDFKFLYLKSNYIINLSNSVFITIFV